MELITEERVIELLMMFVGSGLLGLFGFVWKISHRVSILEKQIAHEIERRKSDSQDFRRDIDMIISNVDKNKEWSINRMMSIAKEMPR
jgi:hypothetical protein|tara:strand:+ start:1567 stop:1830 length:264 start_codon:yes stop_codon:yes gene_type:complete